MESVLHLLAGFIAGIALVKSIVWIIGLKAVGYNILQAVLIGTLSFVPHTISTIVSGVVFFEDMLTRLIFLLGGSDMATFRLKTSEYIKKKIMENSKNE